MTYSMLIFLLVSIVSTICFADWNFPDEGSLYITGKYEYLESTHMGTKFIRANERTPGDAIEIYKGLQEGVYVSVGFERSFLAAAAAPNVTHLLILDIEPKILEFARFNILLLKVATNLEDYLFLRMEASYEELATRFKASGLRGDYLEWATQPDLYQDWKSLMHETLRMKGHPLRSRFMPNLFQKVNYTENLEQFKKIQSMAKAGHIRAVRANIATPFKNSDLAAKLSGLKISALDISNAWRWDYLGTLGLGWMIDSWTKLINQDTQLILSVFNPKLIFGRRWVYLSFPLMKLVDKSMSIFRVSLHSWEIMGGKEFKKNSFNDLPTYDYSCKTVLLN